MAAGTDGAAVDIAAAMITVPTAARDWLVIVPVVLPLACGALGVMLRRFTRLQPVLAIIALALVAAADLALLVRVMAEGPVTMVMGRWLPPFGIAFTVDPAGAALALTAAVCGLAGAFYALADVDGPARRAGFFPFLLLMLAGVSGSFLTGDIFNLYVWFEVLLISSFGLLVLGGTPRQIDGTVKYGLLNLIATTLFLIATGYLYGLIGTLNMADIAISLAGRPLDGPVIVIAALYLVAFGMKAAAFPLNAWLPASYHTPKIVVAAVFAGLLTKVGAYALLRTLAMLMPAERAALAPAVAWIAALTILTSALLSLAQTEIRRSLGFMVITGIGFVLAGLAVGGERALSGSLLYAIHSMLAMTAIYLTVGAVERVAGSSSLARLGGLYRDHPWLSAAFFLLMLAVAGLPPMSGFWPKAVLVGAALDAGAGWLAAAMLAGGLLTTLALGRIWLLAFWRPAADGRKASAVRLPAAVIGPILALVAIVAWLGLAPETALAIATRGAAGLVDPAAYLDAVFGGGR